MFYTAAQYGLPTLAPRGYATWQLVGRTYLEFTFFHDHQTNFKGNLFRRQWIDVILCHGQVKDTGLHQKLKLLILT